jgi:UDP-glucose 4-epimerase
LINLEGKRFLVTGGAGFIGSHICEEIVKQGKEVVCVDNFTAGKRKNLEPWWDDNLCTLAEGDIRDSTHRSSLKHFEGVDVVFHNAASKCTVCRDNPKKDLEVNAWGAWQVFEASRLAGVKKVVHASTGSVYGGLQNLFVQTEKHDLNPRSFYGVSKLAGERYLKAFKDYYPDFRYSILRYFHVYGPRQDCSNKGGVIPIFIRRIHQDKPIKIFGDGNQIRFFTWVNDVVATNFMVANSYQADNQAYNVAHHKRTSITELAHTIKDLMGKPHIQIEYSDWRPGDIKHFNVTSAKLQKLGLTLDVDLSDGLKQTIDWYVGVFERTPNVSQLSPLDGICSR